MDTVTSCLEQNGCSQVFALRRSYLTEQEIVKSLFYSQLEHDRQVNTKSVNDIEEFKNFREQLTHLSKTIEKSSKHRTMLQRSWKLSPGRR